VNLLPVLLPAAAVAFIAKFQEWFQTDWHWLWLICAIFAALAIWSSLRQYLVLHPVLDIEIDASKPIETDYLDWGGARNSVITLPAVIVNTRSSPKCQLEFQLVGRSWTLGQYPMSRIIQEVPKFTSSMTNPKVFGAERPGGDFTRNLNFAALQSEIGSQPDLDGLQLRFRNRYVVNDQWTGFPVPGVFDSRLSKQSESHT
jgi:hypothetical protein